MFSVHSGSGAQDYSLGEPCFTSEQWGAFRGGAVQLLRARGFEGAAHLLETLPFTLYEGGNFFGDEFVVLYAELPIAQYAEIVERYSDRMNCYEFSQVASALNEICPGYVRFIGFGASIDEPVVSVQEPELTITNRTVQSALADARQLIASRGSTSGVDRVHTAFHGYLHAICDDAGIATASDASITTLFRTLREQHPAFQQRSKRDEDIVRMLRALATIVDTLNPLRNRATLAHPNLSLLEQPEADLVLNSVHTLLHYVNSKVS